MKLIYGLVLGISFSLGAQAAYPVADNMTCAQAVAYYQKYKRIYVIANGKDVVPIYGMTPAAERNRLQCGGRGSMQVGYWVHTRDSKHCVIAYRCS